MIRVPFSPRHPDYVKSVFDIGLLRDLLEDAVRADLYGMMRLRVPPVRISCPHCGLAERLRLTSEGGFPNRRFENFELYGFCPVCQREVQLTRTGLG